MAVRAPLIISYPGQSNKGSTTDNLVEFVDIYPTVAELAGLQPGAALEGESLLPVLENPGTEWKDAVFSYYPRGPRLGTSMRTSRYRLTAWKHKETGETEYELYDHAVDPDENQNVAYLPGYDSIKTQLGQRLEQGLKTEKVF